MSNIRVNRIVLLVNGREISLTLEEAEELFNALGELFEKKVTYIPYEKKVYEPRRPYTYPSPYITWVYTSSQGTGQKPNSAGQWLSYNTAEYPPTTTTPAK